MDRIHWIRIHWILCVDTYCLLDRASIRWNPVNHLCLAVGRSLNIPVESRPSNGKSPIMKRNRRFYGAHNLKFQFILRIAKFSGRLWVLSQSTILTAIDYEEANRLGDPKSMHSVQMEDSEILNFFGFLYQGGLDPVEFWTFHRKTLKFKVKQ